MLSSLLGNGPIQHPEGLIYPLDRLAHIRLQMIGGLVSCHLVVATKIYDTLRIMRMILNLEQECSVSDLASFPSCAFSTVVTLDYPNWLVKLFGQVDEHWTHVGEEPSFGCAEPSCFLATKWTPEPKGINQDS